MAKLEDSWAGPLAGRAVIIDDVITAGTAIRESIDSISAAWPALTRSVWHWPSIVRSVACRSARRCRRSKPTMVCGALPSSR